MALLLASGACAPADGGDEAGGSGVASGEPAPVVVAEVWETGRDTLDNVDSPAVWHGPDGRHWVMTTAKEGDVLRVSDATDGRPVRRVGGSGADLGEFERPNGVAVAGDRVFVVERDNHRVQVLALPGFEPLGTFGGEVLRRPYGLAVARDGPDAVHVFVTDNWEVADDVAPPDSLLDTRVHRFRVELSETRLMAEHEAAFGETAGRGILHKVESIAVDPAHDQLLVAEEEEGDSRILVYTPDGAFTGREIPTRFFPHEAEGIVLYPCGDEDGYWVATDQDETRNTFHVFRRGTLEHLGSFQGERVRNTDGIAVTARSFPGFEAGAFFAVHDDGSTVAFRWTDVARALGISPRCGF